MSKGSKHMNYVQKEKADSSVSEEVMNNPEILASLQDEVGNRLKAIKKYKQLPEKVKRRVRALKNLQLDTIKIEEDFFRELSQLEAKFSNIYQNLYDKRYEIVNGNREPTDQECQYDSDTAEDVNESMNKLAITAGDGEPVNNIIVAAEQTGGVPEFWLTVLQNSELIQCNIQPHDVSVLKYLTDIKCVLKSGDDQGFVLEFYFSKNDFFTDEKLTKEYFVQVSATSDCPFDYEGPEIVRTVGCNIHWLPGKNITVKLVKKVQKSKNRSDKRTITKVVKNDSFFNFFEPPTESLYGDPDILPEVESLLESDFEMAQYIRERIIPRAVLYFTGEAIEEEFDDDEDDDDDDDDSDDIDDDSEGGGFNKRENSDSQATDNQKPDCKQQ